MLSNDENPIQNSRVADELSSGYDSESDDDQDITFFIDDCSDSYAAAIPENTVGYVYCMTNLAMPGLVKIGITIDLAARRDKLFSTGVPLPFEIAFARKLENTITPLQAERTLFRIFAQHRVHPKREFFRLALDPVSAAFSLFGSDVDLSVLPSPRPRAQIGATVPSATSNSPKPRIPKLAFIGTCQIRHKENYAGIGNYDVTTAKISVVCADGNVVHKDSLNGFAGVVGCGTSSGRCFEVKVGDGDWTAYREAFKTAKQARALAAAMAANSI